LIDPERVGVFGGSHGGYMAGWLIGHPDTKDVFKAAVLWNPVINQSYMVAQTDIPDWVYACNLNEEHRYEITSEENKLFFDRSPISVVNNVQAAAMLLIGHHDNRVPPNQAYHYYQILRS